jgi:hypothetical protein
MARPIHAAGVFSPLSEGKFPLCHWGVLVSDEKNLHQWLSERDNVVWNTTKSWGTLIELYRDPLTNLNKPHIVLDFGHFELRKEWRMFALRLVGSTYGDDKTSYETGTKPNPCQGKVLTYR